MHRDIAEQRAVFAALDRQLKPAVFTVELEPPLPFEKGLRIGGAVVAPALIARHVGVAAVGGKVGQIVGRERAQDQPGVSRGKGRIVFPYQRIRATGSVAQRRRQAA